MFGGPMDLSRSGAKVQMQPDTGVTFADVVGVDGAKLVGGAKWFSFSMHSVLY